MQSRKELSDRFLDLKDKRAALESQVDAVKEEQKQAEQDLILSMEEEGLQNFRDDERGLVYIRQDTFASVEDQAKLYAHLRANNMGDVIKETVNAKTLAAIAKEHPDLPGAKISYATRLGVRK